jgi:hypothetical protein
MATQKFIISTDTGFAELEYDDVKTKKLVGFCSTSNVKILSYMGVASLIFAFVVFVYDFFKDIGRSFSATKDLFSGKQQDSLAKYVGFTKGNITRLALKVGAFILGLVLLYLSSSMGKKVCYGRGDTFFLAKAENTIKYDQEGKPVEIVIPKE